MTSFGASLLNFLLWIFQIRRYFMSERAVKDLCNNTMIVSKTPSKVPASLSQKYHVREQEMWNRSGSNRWTILTIQGKQGEKGEPNMKLNIFYFHGGAFVVGAGWVHWDLVDRLMKAGVERGFEGITITIPLYGRCPENSHADFYPKMLDYYSNNYSSEYSSKSRMIFMGDSAGGNIALSFALQLDNHKLKGPDRLILLSPWLDLSLTNDEIKKRQEADYILARDGLTTAGKWWCRSIIVNDEVNGNYYSDKLENHLNQSNKTEEIDLKNPLFSPFYARDLFQERVHVFIGSNDIFEPDCVSFASKFPNNVTLHYYEGMCHVWMLYPVPMMTEKVKAINEIFEIIFQT